MAKRHFLVYLGWDTLLDWRKQRTVGKPIHEDAPFAYGSDQIRMQRLVRPSDILWIICSPRFGPYRLPPSLIAHLEVCGVVDQALLGPAKCTFIKIPKASEPWRYVALANRKKSRYYPLNNAYRTLISLTFVGKQSTLNPNECDHCQKLIGREKRKPATELYAGLPSHLQTIRQIAPGEEKQLEEFAAKVVGGRMIFLSYRHIDAGEMAAELFLELEKRRVYTWLDNQVMPQQVTKGRKRVAENVLSGALSDGVRQSTLFVALVTQTYFDKPWTKLEWDEALKEMANPRRARPLRVLAVRMGGALPTDILGVEVVASDDIGTIMNQLLNTLEQ